MLIGMLAYLDLKYALSAPIEIEERMDTDLLRQRRNLLLISIALILFDFTEISITKIQVLGAEIPIGKPGVLLFFAWILWAYFLLRYYQYLKVAPIKDIKATLAQRLDTYARMYTNATAIQDSIGQPYDDYKIVRTGPLRWSYIVEDYDPTEGSMEGLPRTLPTTKLLFWWIKSGTYVSVHTPHATDFLLPFIVAFAAPVATFWSPYSAL